MNPESNPSPLPEWVPQKLTNLLDDDIPTLILREGCAARAKRGHVGSLKLESIDENIWSREGLLDLIDEIEGLVQTPPEGGRCLKEISREGCSVFQIESLRITASQPPFSEGVEITVVRPLVKLSLEDYKLRQQLLHRLGNHQRGVLVSGAPGSGKSTFSAAVAEWLVTSSGAIVKTMEAPRDLPLGDEITQYAPLEGDLEKTAEIIFLVRPDFVIFDEVRRGKDFSLFGDVRLAGVGLLGVTHANSALDAIQRMVGRVELGIIAQVVDTVIHLSKGDVIEVLTLSMVVRPPTGMHEELSRPLVEIRRLYDSELTHEIFSFGTEVVVVPIDEKKYSRSRTKGNRINDHDLMKAAIEAERYLSKRLRASVEVTMVNNGLLALVPNHCLSEAIGKGGQEVKRLERRLGGINVQIEGTSRR